MIIKMLLTTAAIAVSVSATGLFEAHIGPIWPSSTLETSSATSWDLGIKGGTLIDNKVGFGIGADFLWNSTTEEVKVTGTSLYRVDREEQTYMVPIFGFITVDPIPEYTVHPAGTFAIGYNSMIYNFSDKSNNGLTTNQNLLEKRAQSGYYYGLFIKGSIDANINLGSSSVVFLGGDYQSAPTRSTSKDDNNDYYKRDMSGFGIHFGVRLSL